MLLWKICRLTCVSGSVFGRCKSTEALSSLQCSTYRSVFHSLPSPRSLLDLFCSPALSCTSSHCSCTCSRTPPLLAALLVSAEQVQASLHHWLLFFFLALPLQHLLTGLSQFQHPAHSAAHSSQSACPHHESFMNQCLFSALIGESLFQTSDSLLGRGVLLDSQKGIVGPAGHEITPTRLLSHHTYNILWSFIRVQLVFLCIFIIVIKSLYHPNPISAVKFWCSVSLCATELYCCPEAY